MEKSCCALNVFIPSFKPDGNALAVVLDQLVAEPTGQRFSNHGEIIGVTSSALQPPLGRFCRCIITPGTLRGDRHGCLVNAFVNSDVGAVPEVEAVSEVREVDMRVRIGRLITRV